MPVLAILAAVLLLSAPADPPEVQALRSYLRGYQQSFAAVIADEVTVQTVTRGRETVRTRTTRGEFFTAFIENDGIWMSVHDIAEVDGVAIADRVSLRTLLATNRLQQVGPAIAQSNARFNIGPFVRNFNEPTLALQLLSSRRASGVSLSRERVDRSPAGGLIVTLAVRLDPNAPFIGTVGGRRASTRGTVVVEPGTGVIQRTTLTIDSGDVRAVLHTDYAPDDRLGLWLPSHFGETYTRRGEATTVATTFSNYRRFEGSGRLIE